MELGLYQHYKGQFYHVVAIGKHEETHEELVIYRALYGEYTLWVRPKSIFCQTIMHENTHKPRFYFIKPL